MLLNLNTYYADTDADLCIRIMSLCCSGGFKFCFIIDNLFFGRKIFDFSINDWIKEKIHNLILFE